MGEVIYTGENDGAGYEYPLECPLGICAGSPVAMTEVDGEWHCDECGKVVVQWERADQQHNV